MNDLLDFIWLITRDAFWSGIAALGFAILFNVPRRTLFGCVVGGAAGHAVRTGLMEGGATIELATLAGAIVIGFLGEFFARRNNAPSAIFTVSAAIPMVPGVFAYRTMLGLINISEAEAGVARDLLVETTINATKTGFILAAIAGGTITPQLLFQRIKPVV